MSEKHADPVLDERWRAVAERDARYDGVFFYGVRTTGVFCRPSCVARKPLRKNSLFFDSAEEALRAGFRPCRKCRPDIPDYDPGRDIVERAKALCARPAAAPDDGVTLHERLNVSANQLMRLFRSHEGCTIRKFVASVKIRRAMALLGSPDADILDVALKCGFGSLSHFYRCFRAATGTTPARYRMTGGIPR